MFMIPLMNFQIRLKSYIFTNDKPQSLSSTVIYLYYLKEKGKVILFPCKLFADILIPSLRVIVFYFLLHRMLARAVIL